MIYVTVDNLEQLKKVCLIYRKMGKLPISNNREEYTYDSITRSGVYKAYTYSDDKLYYISMYNDTPKALVVSTKDVLQSYGMFICEYYLDKLEKKLKTKII